MTLFHCHNKFLGVPCGYYSRASDLRCAGCERINITDHIPPDETEQERIQRTYNRRWGREWLS